MARGRMVTKRGPDRDRHEGPPCSSQFLDRPGPSGYPRPTEHGRKVLKEEHKARRVRYVGAPAYRQMVEAGEATGHPKWRFAKARPDPDFR